MTTPDEDLLAGIVGYARIVGRLATAPEVQRAVAYNAPLREALRELFRAQSKAASAATRVLGLLGKEDGDEFSERRVERVLLSVRRRK